MYSLSVADLIEINDFFDSAEMITIIYTASDIVICELYDNGRSEDFYLTRRELIMVLKDFYVYDICEIVRAGTFASIEVEINKSNNDYPVEITINDGTRYCCNQKELNYINR